MSYPHTTKEEIEKNYQFQLAKRIVKKKFPWVKDIRLPDNINEYSLIFLDFYIDPWMLAKDSGVKVSAFLRNDTPFFRQSPFLSVLFNEDVSDIDKEIKKTLDSVHDSEALPRELKIPNRRKFDIGSFQVSDDAKFDDEYTEKSKFR